MKRISLLLLCAVSVLFAGCSSLPSFIKDRDALYAPVPLDPKVEKPEEAPTTVAYRQVLKAAQDEYMKELALKDAKERVRDLIDTGIAAANNNCREWLTLVSAAEQQWEQGTGNLTVIGNAITATLGALKASYDLITGYGIAATLVSGFNNNFKVNVLAMADADVQLKVRQVMTEQANQLRLASPAMTFPQARDALSQYAVLCLPGSAKAMIKSSLNSTVTTVTSEGALKSVMPTPGK